MADDAPSVNAAGSTGKEPWSSKPLASDMAIGRFGLTSMAVIERPSRAMQHPREAFCAVRVISYRGSAVRCRATAEGRLGGRHA